MLAWWRYCWCFVVHKHALACGQRCQGPMRGSFCAPSCRFCTSFCQSLIPKSNMAPRVSGKTPLNTWLGPILACNSTCPHGSHCRVIGPLWKWTLNSCLWYRRTKSKYCPCSRTSAYALPLPGTESYERDMGRALRRRRLWYRLPRPLESRKFG